MRLLVMNACEAARLRVSHSCEVVPFPDAGVVCVELPVSDQVQAPRLGKELTAECSFATAHGVPLGTHIIGWW